MTELTLDAYLRGVRRMIEEMHPQRSRELMYSCYEALVLDAGRAWEAGPAPDWLRRGKLRDCYYNSLRLMIQAIGEGRPLWYVEGYYLAGWPDGTQGIPTQHAWCVDDQDRVIDPTWPHPELTAYHGLILPWQDVVRFTVDYQCGILASEYILGNPLLATGQLFPTGWKNPKRRTRRSRRREHAGAPPSASPGREATEPSEVVSMLDT